VRLEHQFSVPAPVDQVWRALLDPERVAPCMPGATLTGVEGNTFNGSVKVKLGPVSLLYKGSGEFVETDDADHRLVLKAAGKDARGNGTANATVTVTIAGNGAETSGTVVTDLSITGRPAQFGRGMIAEVGGRILDTFAGNLAAELAPEPEPKPEPVTGNGVRPDAAARPADTPERDRIQEPPKSGAAPIDLLGYAGPSVLKRAAPLLVLAAIIILVVWRRRR
jgi:carbon monoxide dehydrogenase subunit G